MSETKPLPVVDYLKIPDNGDPYLEGYRCKKCGATYLGERNVCSKCFARDEMEIIKLSETGILHSYAIVFRSFPGIDVPYISAIVDLDGGGTISTNELGWAMRAMGMNPTENELLGDQWLKSFLNFHYSVYI